MDHVHPKSCPNDWARSFSSSVKFTFQVLYMFVAIEIGTRRFLHVRVTDHPAEWTRQLGGLHHEYRLEEIRQTCLWRSHKVTQRSEFRTILDNGSANDTSRSLTETWIRQE